MLKETEGRVIDFLKAKVPMSVVVSIVTFSGSIILYLMTAIFSLETRASVGERNDVSIMEAMQSVIARVDRQGTYMIDETRATRELNMQMKSDISEIKGILQGMEKRGR